MQVSNLGEGNYFAAFGESRIGGILRQLRISGMRQKLRKFFRENSLSFAFGMLFALAVIGQSISGWKFYDEQRGEHGLAQISYWRFWRTGTFLDSALTNWQAAVLQLACLIIFSEGLYQRGASHSRKPERKHGSRKRSEELSQRKKTSWIYRNSLSLAFTGMVMATFILHVIFATVSYNETRALQRQPPVTTAHFFESSGFWFLTLQTWQAEFFAILVFIILTIFLRQENSAESKPPEASDKQTGDANQ